jgi:hypothetical protein
VKAKQIIGGLGWTTLATGVNVLSQFGFMADDFLVLLLTSRATSVKLAAGIAAVTASAPDLNALSRGPLHTLLACGPFTLTKNDSEWRFASAALGTPHLHSAPRTS